VERKRIYTVKEAAELTGLSPKAVSRRLERGSLRSVLRRGRRLIPDAELVRVGLIPAEGEQPGGAFASSPLLKPPFTPSARAASEEGPEAMLASLFAELLDRLERQASEITRFRALTVQAESLSMEREISELRSRLLELETNPSPAARIGRAEPTSALGSLWLPPAATRPAAPQRNVAARPPGRAPGEAARPSGPRRSFTWRIPALLLEAAFIGAVAVLASVSELSTPLVIVSVGLAWIIAATIEWLRWRQIFRS
jgi:excisionase family DNA binding protein